VSELCALAHQVAGHHGPPMFGSEWGLICNACDQIHRGRWIDGPPEELTLPGVASLKAFEARRIVVDDKGVEHDLSLQTGVSWEWLPYVVPAGVGPGGERLYEQPDPPVHCKKARSGGTRARGHAPRRRAQLFDLELLLPHLPAPQREVLHMQVFGGLSYEAIATELGVPVSTVRERLRSARTRIQALQAA